MTATHKFKTRLHLQKIVTFREDIMPNIIRVCFQIHITGTAHIMYTAVYSYLYTRQTNFQFCSFLGSFLFHPCFLYHCSCFRDSLVSNYSDTPRLGKRGIGVRVLVEARDFSPQRSQQSWHSPNHLSNRQRGAKLEIKRLRCRCDHSHLFRAQITDEVVLPLSHLFT
jgi:hypothetical protein